MTLKMQYIKPLKLLLPASNFDDPKVAIWAKELINNLNNNLINVLDSNREKVEENVNRINRMSYDFLLMGG